MTRVNGNKLSMKQVANAKEILITDVREIREYADGKRTDKIPGYAYEVTANDFIGTFITVAMIMFLRLRPQRWC